MMHKLMQELTTEKNDWCS